MHPRSADSSQPRFAALIRLAAALLLLLAPCGCLPGMRANEPLDAGSDLSILDTPKADVAPDGDAAGDSGALADGDAADSVEDAGTDAVADADAATAVDAADAATADGQDVPPGGGGCSSDADCAKLPFGPCRIGVCNLATGLCVPQDSQQGKPCELSACVTEATCNSGSCTGKDTACNDNNPCTKDSCDAGLGCIFSPLTMACDDGKKCSSGDTCLKGKCVGILKNCEDGNQCTDDLCNPASGECNHKPIASDKTPCAAGNAKACSGPALCAGGECKAASACDDGNPCTYDLCADGAKCANLPMSGDCVPAGGKADPCNPGVCVLDAAVGLPQCVTSPHCQDKVCSITKCATGLCSYEKIDDSSPCEDGDTCVDQSVCVKGQCKGAKVSCDDGNPCTAEVCKPGIGCVAAPANDGAPCEDGSGCTSKDTCKSGACVGSPLSCDDQVACTKDSCEPAGGCVHVKGPDCGP